MKYNILPYQQVGNFHFNVSRNINRDIFSIHDDKLYCHARVDRKSPDDSYDKLGLTLIYNKYNRFSAIEMREPSQPVFREKELLKMSWNELLTWFNTLDNTLVVLENSFISYKLGISVFTRKPNNTEARPTLITIFAKDFFNTKIGVPDPKSANSFHVQVAYIEPTPLNSINEKTIEDGIKKMLVNNKEKGILLWNQIPISFDYTSDLPEIIMPIVNMVAEVVNNKEGKCDVSFNCNSFETNWFLKWDDTFILIDANWIRIAEDCKNVFANDNFKLHQLTLLKDDFLSEWKLLLKQISNILSKKRLKVPSKNITIRLIDKSYKSIPSYGKFYKEESSLYSKQLGRKQINFNNLSRLKQVILVSMLIGVIALLVYIFNSKEGFFESLIKYAVITVLISLFFTIGIAYLIKRPRQK